MENRSSALFNALLSSNQIQVPIVVLLHCLRHLLCVIYAIKSSQDRYFQILLFRMRLGVKDTTSASIIKSNLFIKTTRLFHFRLVSHL